MQLVHDAGENSLIREASLGELRAAITRDGVLAFVKGLPAHARGLWARLRESQSPQAPEDDVVVRNFLSKEPDFVNLHEIYMWTAPLRYTSQQR